MSVKGPHSSCQLAFHQLNVRPILRVRLPVCRLSSREGIVHLRCGLRPLVRFLARVILAPGRRGAGFATSLLVPAGSRVLAREPI